MPRIAAIVLTTAVLGGYLFVGSIPAPAQGISGVTRRTPTLERQATARSFFDAAGIATAGAGVTSGGSPATTTPLQGVPLAATPPRTRDTSRLPGSMGSPGTARALAIQPTSPRNPIVSRVNLPPVHQRPFLVPSVPAGTVRTVPNRPINPGPNHVAPSVPPRTP